MQTNRTGRQWLGFTCLFLGVVLLGGAAHVSGHSGVAGTTKSVTVATSAAVGGFLTFVVSRRLLISSENSD